MKSLNIISTMPNTTDAIVITCIDFRFQRFINTWLKYVLIDYIYDRVAIAGGILDLDYILKQIEISNKLHRIKKVILINHENCGAYGSESTHKRHEQDLHKATTIIKKIYPHLTISCFYIMLDGTFKNISKTKPGKTLVYPYH
jgi:carbonic anhydrase